MLSPADSTTTVFAVLLLLLLSLITIEICRRDQVGKKQTERQFLFLGKSQIHALASNMGSLFSLTYFFGGAFIYGYTFGTLYLIAAAATFVILLPLIPWLIGQFSSTTQSSDHKEPPTGNLLLDHLRQRLRPADYRTTLRLYAIIYTLLLVEELAVSRLIIATLIPAHPLIVTFTLAVIIGVIAAYLSLGGFRSVLNSDLVQMAMIAAFLLVLVFLIAGSTPTEALDLSLPSLDLGEYGGMLWTLLFGVAWFVSSVDFYSRLNFTPSSRWTLAVQRKRLAVLSLVLVFFVLALGILYGMRLRGVVSDISSPETYASETIQHFLGSTVPVVGVCFLGSVFCMIFTTIDTLLITMLQIGAYSGSRFLRRQNLLQILLVAVILSTLLNFRSVSYFGIFIGSLMLLPLIAVFKAGPPRLAYWTPPSLRSMEWALVLSVILFLSGFDLLRMEFGAHFLLPGFVLLFALITTAIHRGYHMFANRRVASEDP